MNIQDPWRGVPSNGEKVPAFSLLSKLRTLMRILSAVISLIILHSPDTSTAENSGLAWQKMEDGLQVAELRSQQDSATNKVNLLIVKLDPEKFRFVLMCASQNGNRKMSVKDWCERYHLLGAVNAGMYQQDGLTSVGYLKTNEHINNGHMNRNMAVLAFNPVDAGMPQIQIIDREFQDFEVFRHKYRSFLQSIRMISLENKNVWSPQSSGWSTLAIAIDTQGQVLLIFNESRLSVHDLIEVLLSLPLSIRNAMYLEGGPQASLYLSTPTHTIERHGLWENGLDRPGIPPIDWPIPNILGILRK